MAIYIQEYQIQLCPALEERLASIEKGIGAICTSSGQAALHLTVATLLNSGDHIISSDRIYGGSRNLLDLTSKDLE